MKGGHDSKKVAGRAFSAFIAMTVGGIFSYDPGYLYAAGNSAYVSSVITAGMAALLFCASLSSVKRAGTRDACELVESRFGRIARTASAVPLSIALILCAARPISIFAQVLHRLVFDGSDYYSILAFILPVTFYMAVKGHVSVARTSVCVSFVLAASLVLVILLSAKGYESFRLYPLIGDGIPHMMSCAVSDLVFIAAPLLSMTGVRDLSYERATHGCVRGDLSDDRANRLVSGIKAAGGAALLITLSRLAAGLAYDPQSLSEMLIPLYRIGFVSPRPGAMFRFDKIFIMIWLTCCMVSSAYCVDSAAELLSGSGKRFKTAVLFICCAVLALCVLPLFVSVRVWDKLTFISAKYGALLLIPYSALTIAAGLSGQMKRSERA